jgi:glutamine synthetase
MSNPVFTSHTFLNPTILDRYLKLPQGEKCQAEYIWIGGTGHDIRSKTKTLNKKVSSPAELPIWNYDGSSTGQAPGADSEVMLKPQAIFPDPFRGGDNIIVVCDCYKPDMTPIDGNTRAVAEDIFSQKQELVPWFGIEQEYTLFEADGVTPFGWPKHAFPAPQGPYYCSNGTENSYGRPIVEAHYRACLYAGVNISGINGEVMPGQWEYQVGPSTGIESGDHMLVSRYLLTRVAEDFGVIVSLDPKPIPGDWNGAGCHTNFSTEPMRQPGGKAVIIDALEKLKLKHAEHIAAYGEGNERRLTGKHETASIEAFSYGVANRGCSCRIPRSVEADDCGYFEDRRPASNMDPYVVTSMVFKTCCL